MIQYYRMRAQHLAWIDPQDAQAEEYPQMMAPCSLPAYEYSAGLTGFVGTKCLGCAGLIEKEDHVIVWALLSKEASKHFLEITRKVDRVLKSYKGKTIRAYVRPGFKQGARWMRVLGFSLAEAGVSVEGCPPHFRFDIYDRKEA